MKVNGDGKQPIRTEITPEIKKELNCSILIFVQEI